MSERSHVELEIRAMTCDSCARHVTKALEAVAGVSEVDVPGWQSGRATLVAGAEVTDKALRQAVEEAGYRATVKQRRPTEGERRAPTIESADYDLLVIGGASAGFAAAIKGAELDARVLLVEGATIGGTCVNIGCVPSKNLIRAAELVYHSAHPAHEGLAACGPTTNWQQVIQQKDDLVTSLRQSKYVDVVKAYPNITLVRGQALLSGKRGVNVDGETYVARKIVLATGAHSWAPPIPGLEEAGYLDSTAAFELQELPESMIVVGAGAIGLELTQLFSRFGVKVTLLEALPRIAPAEDPRIGHALARYLAQEGIEVHAGVRIQRVDRSDGTYRIQAEMGGEATEFTAAQLLVATGRRANTADLGCEEAGIKLGKRGEIIVDEHLQTTNPAVYAAGDCIGEPMFVYVAAYAGGLAAENALKGAGRVYDLQALPRVTFTDPQVASVGLDEGQAREQGYSVKTTVLELKYVPQALVAYNTRGLIKLVADADSDRLLGVQILAAEAGDVIQEATLVVRLGLKVSDLLETFHPYLTMVEGLKLAALTFEKDVTRLSCCAS